MTFESLQMASLAVALMILLENRLRILLALTALHGGLLAALLVAHHGFEDAHTWLLLPMLVLFKIFLTPGILLWTARRARVPESADERLGYFPTLFLLSGASWACARFGAHLAAFAPEIPELRIVLALGGIALGLAGFIVRRHWIPLMVGFMLFENAVFAFTLILGESVPWGVELGAFADAVLILIAAGTLQLWSRDGGEESA